MKHLASLFLLSFLAGCGKQSANDDQSRSVSVESSQQLAPKDLGIQKQRFVAFPKPQEVAIFRSSIRSLLEPHQNRIYDQIHWTNGGQAANDVVIAPLSFYLGYPEHEANDREQLFRDSWRLQAGGFGYDIKEYTFVESGWSSSDERATGKVIYTKNHVTESEDLVFEFEMFVLPISEARRIHPNLEKLGTKIEKGTTSWQAAYLVNEEAQQAGSGQPATRPESTSEGSDKPQPESEGRSR